MKKNKIQTKSVTADSVLTQEEINKAINSVAANSVTGVANTFDTFSDVSNYLDYSNSLSSSQTVKITSNTSEISSLNSLADGELAIDANTGTIYVRK